MERKTYEQHRLAVLEYFIDRIKEEIFLLTEDGRFMYVNQEVSRVLGYCRDELLEMGVSCIDPDYQGAHWKAHWESLKTTNCQTFETYHLSKEGKRIPVEVHANFFEYEGIGYNLSIVHDITERKNQENLLRQKEEEFRTLVEQTPDTIARYDAECIRLYANPALASAMGLSVEEILGKKPTAYYASAQAVAYEEKVKEVIATGVQGEVEYTWPDSKGEQIVSQIRISPEKSSDGVIRSVMAIGRDVTAFKQTENALSEKTDELEKVLELFGRDSIIRKNS